jgi:hypothetical protein
MKMTEKCSLWVVYRMEIKGKPIGANAVCEQGEWDAMERAHPAHRKLIQEGIANEGEAERLARSSPIDTTTDEISDTENRGPAFEAASIPL